MNTVQRVGQAAALVAAGIVVTAVGVAAGALAVWLIAVLRP